MTKNKAFILLDRSGSMQNLWNEAIGSVNGYVEKLENADIMVAVFDSVSYDVIRNCSREEYKSITSEEVSPRGSTPLLDSATRIIWNMLDSKADRAMLVIMTDGEENCSQLANINHVKKLITQIEEKNYDILFLGANFDKIGDIALSLGRNDMSKFVTSSTNKLNQTMAVAAGSTRNYFSTGQVATNVYTDDLKKHLSS